MSSQTVRYYTSDDSFTCLVDVPSSVREIQVALAFARDYDSNGNSTNGKFKPYWNLEKANPTAIKNFKDQAHNCRVKFILTIGGRDILYPFSVTPTKKDSWVSNATKSLGDIIRFYHLDGIDVYYEHITSTGNDFVDTMEQLIANLKRNIEAVTVTSIARLDSTHYLPLYKKCNEYIDTVVYQCHTEENRINTIGELKVVFDRLTYPKEKLLAGYSYLSRDWCRVSVALYFATVGQLVSKKTVFGTSIWTVGDEPVIPFDPKLVPELVSLVINDRGQ